MKIAVGSSRAAKIAAVRSAATRIASINAVWAEPVIISCDVETDAPAMPLTDEELMLGARARAMAVREAVSKQGNAADFYIGLEGGFHAFAPFYNRELPVEPGYSLLEVRVAEAYNHPVSMLLY